MNMREAFVTATKDILRTDDKTALILGGISVASFLDEISEFPKRVFDAGIMEQAGISIAAGMSITGMIPIYHTIAPFLAERAYEQLKIDFGYQMLGGNFVSNGASLDYSSFGATHQCPAEISILKQIPGMQIVTAGTAKEFDTLYRANYNNGQPTYYRLCRDTNDFENDVVLGKANVIKLGSRLTVVAVGPMLKVAMQATKELDVTVLYYSSVAPFDYDTLSQNCSNGKVILCEPYYEGALLYDVMRALRGHLSYVDTFGIPHVFCDHYGTTFQHMEHWKLTANSLREKILEVL